MNAELWRIVVDSLCLLVVSVLCLFIGRAVSRKDETQKKTDTDIKELRDCQQEHGERIARLEERTREN